MLPALPNAEDLGETKLTDEQLKVISDTKSEDWDAPKKEAEVEPDKTAKPKEEVEKQENKEADDTVVKTADELEAEKKASLELKAKQEAESAENLRLEKKAKDLGKTADEVKKLEVEEKTDNERVEKLAREEGITIDEVRENEIKDRSIADRHGKDPFKLARALRKEQSEYGKIKGETEQLRDYKARTEAAQARFSEQRFDAQTNHDREEIVSQYRKNFPENSDELSDDAVFERGRGIIKEALKRNEQERFEKAKSEATKKRTELIKSIPEEFKDYIPEVKDMLSECSDDQILDRGFSVDYLATYARGRKFTSDYIKSIEESAYKRGAEQSKMIPKVPNGKPTSQKSEGSAGALLSDKDKSRAEEVYGRREGWSREKMHDEYAKHDKGKDF